MAMIDTAHTAPLGAVTIYRVFVEPASRVVTWVRERAEAARTANALSRLSSAQLDDIGMTPADIAHYSRQSGVFF